MEKINPDVQHEIQNAIVNYRGLRKRMFRCLLNQVELIGEIDKQMLRAEKALRGQPFEKEGRWVRLRKSLTKPFDVFLR